MNLSTTSVAVDATNALVGMYVARLDRPWLETPFVFQGFEIRDRVEIDLLQSYCSTIYVDVTRGSLSEAEIRALATKRPGVRSTTAELRRRRRGPGRFARWLQKWLLRFGISSRAALGRPADAAGYPVIATVRGEAPRAFEAFKNVAIEYQRVLERLQQEDSVDLARLKQAVRPVIDSILRNPDAMAWTVFSRRRRGRPFNRAVATSVWCVMFGRQLGFDRRMLEELAIGGLLLDIGNARIPSDILDGEGTITQEDYEQLSHHVEHGVGILAASPGVTQNVLDMVQCHHERSDGSGYPKKLKGNAIPIFGRIAGIADCYDAMTTENAYSPAFSAFDVARTLNEMRGRQFAAEVVEQFLQTVGMFPTGSVVELSNGSVGIVLEQNRENALRPKVMVLLGGDGGTLDKPEILEMRDLPLDVTHARAVWVARGHPHGAFGIDPMDYFKPGTSRN